MKKNSKRILRLLREQYHSLSKNIIDSENEEIPIDSDDARSDGSGEISIDDGDSKPMEEAISTAEPIDDSSEIIASYRSDSGLEFLESNESEK